MSVNIVHTPPKSALPVLNTLLSQRQGAFRLCRRQMSVMFSSLCTLL
jgi:hypothetical protein